MDGHPWLHEQVLTTLTSWWVSFPDHSVVTWQHFCVLRILLLYVHSHMCHFQWFSSRLSMKILNLCGYQEHHPKQLKFCSLSRLTDATKVCLGSWNPQLTHKKGNLTHPWRQPFWKLQIKNNYTQYRPSPVSNYALLCSLLILCVCWV